MTEWQSREEVGFHMWALQGRRVVGCRRKEAFRQVFVPFLRRLAQPSRLHTGEFFPKRDARNSQGSTMKSSRSIGFLFGGVILALLLGASVLTAGCTKAAPHTRAAPIAAIAVTQCGGLVTLYVMLDDHHMLRAGAKSLALFEIQADGKVVESDREPMPFDQAMDLAKRAVIQTRVETACSQPGVAT
jgi:hypothetical protein